MIRATVREIGWQEFAEYGFRGLKGRVNAQGRERVLGALTLWSLWGDAAEFTARAEPADPGHVTFVFVECGGVLARRPGEPWQRVEAALIVAPNGIERTIRFEGAWRMSVAQIPRAAIEAFVPRIPTDIGSFAERRLLDQAMHSFVVSTMRSNALSSAIESYAIEQLVMEMAGAVLLDRVGTGWTQGSPRAVLRDRALAVIAQQAADMDLTPERLARDVQTSLRQLQSVFADAGSSVAGEIRRQRARLAHSLLIDSRYDVLSVEQIAQRSGFRTTMSLRRALEEVYHVGPRTLRASRGAR